MAETHTKGTLLLALNERYLEELAAFPGLNTFTFKTVKVAGDSVSGYELVY